MAGWPVVKKGLARHPIPVILLARLAVDASIHGKGLGSALLKDALLRTAQAADSIGARALLVHTKDDSAKAFYEHFTFEASKRPVSFAAHHERPTADHLGMTGWPRRTGDRVCYEHDERVHAVSTCQHGKAAQPPPRRCPDTSALSDVTVTVLSVAASR